MKSRRFAIVFAVAAVVVTVIGAVVWRLFFSDPGLRRLVPADATAVAVLDVKAFVRNARIDMETLSDIDNTTGVDFARPVYVFTVNGCIGFAAAVSDEVHLDANLTDGRQRGEYRFGMMGSWLVCHDGRRVLGMGPIASLSDDSLMDFMTARMEAGDDGVCELLAEAENHDGVFTAVGTARALPQSLRRQIAASLPKGMGIEQMVFRLDGKSSGDRIRFNARLVGDDGRYKRACSEFIGAFRPVSGNLIAASPQDPAIWVCIGVEGEQFLKLLRRNDGVRTMLLGLNMSVDADLMIKAVRGDVALSVPKVSMRGMPWVIVAEMADMGFMRNSGDWNTGGLGFAFAPLDSRTMCFASSRQYVEGTGTVSPNTELMTLRGGMMGQKIFLTVSLQKVLNAALPMMAVLGYPQRLYKSLEVLERLNVSIGDENCSMELLFNKPINQIIDSWKE